MPPPVGGSRLAGLGKRVRQSAFAMRVKAGDGGYRLIG